MKLRQLLSIAFVLCVFSSCQKGVDWTATNSNTGTGNTGGTGNAGGATGDLLVKVVSVTGTETLTTLYGYDASKRLITEDTKGTSGGLIVDSYKKLYRDANGRIYKSAQLMKLPGLVADTSYTYVSYPNATTNNFTYTTSDVTISGFGSHDSSVYVWNAGGNITSQQSFMSSTLAPGIIMQTLKYDYTYANGNLTQQKSYSDIMTPGSLALIATYNYTFDNNTNPMVANGEFVLTGKVDGASKNNVVKMEMVDATTPANSFTLVTAITYGAGTKPTAAQLPCNRKIAFLLTRSFTNKIFKHNLNAAANLQRHLFFQAI